MLKMEYVNYGCFGRCLEMCVGQQVMRVTCDFGPRIIYFSMEGKNNLFFEDKNDLINNSGEYFDNTYGKNTKWHIYGGHRLWRSPEDLATYYPDNSPVDVTILDNGAVFTSKPELENTKLQKIMTIKVEDDVFVVEHKFINVGDEVANVSLWALSVMEKGGTAYFPYTQEDTGLLPNRNLVFWAYTDIKDKRIDVCNHGLILHQDSKAQSAIKLGFMNQTGEHYYLKDDLLLEISVVPATSNGKYPDFCSSTETYTSENMLEIETLSELQNIPSGGESIHVEYWSIHTVGSPKYKEIFDKINY